MVKYSLSLLETGCNTIDEYVSAFYDKKSVKYSTKNIRAEHCSNCQSLTCDNCFVGDGIKAILQDNPNA